MNDTVRIQDNQIEPATRPSGRGPSGLDSCFIRLQEGTIDETYTDGHIDYVHEI